METVSLNYSYFAPVQATDAAGAIMAPQNSTSVSVTLSDDCIVLSDLIARIGDFIEQAGWVYPEGTYLGLVQAR